MCGRFTQTFAWDDIAHQLGPLDGPPMNLEPRYNVAPSQRVVAVRNAGSARSAVMLRWGLIPPWAGDPGIGHKLINARSETVREKPSFREAFVSRRCVIPADGFFEWQREGGGRQPHLFTMDDRRPFALAGLWERWTPPARPPGLFGDEEPGQPIQSCTILTTTANPVVAPVHHRMPVILEAGSVGAWLDGGEVPLAPFPGERMTSVRVSPLVNSPHNDDRRCIEPVAAA